MLNQSANVEGILGSQIARMGGIYLTTGLVIVLFLLQSRDLGLGQDDTLLGDFVLQRCAKQVRPWRNQTLRTPLGEMKTPFFRNSLLVRVWPWAGSLQ